MPDADQRGLLVSGTGIGSKAERIKVQSRGLRGRLADELAEDTSRLSDEQAALLKFHGSYQQDDRDVRQERKAQDADRDWQFMVRCRIPGGRLTASQYLGIDRLALSYANGTLRITTRQGLQLHGIVKKDLKPAIQDINATLLTTLAACGDVNRNVMACPMQPDHAVAAALANHLTPRTRGYHEVWLDGEKQDSAEPEPEPIYGQTYLPRKFKIAVATPEDNCVDIYTQDVGLVAQGEGYTVLVGGGMGMTHGKSQTHPRLATPLAFVPAHAVVAVVEAIVTTYRDYGDRFNRKHARLKYVIAEQGIDWFRGEVEKRLGWTLSPPRPVQWKGVHDHLGWHLQGDGRWFLGLAVESGRVTDHGDVHLASGLRRAIEKFQPGLSLTPQQNILLTDISRVNRKPLEKMLADHGIATDPTRLGLFRYALACPALPTCGQAVAEAERVLGSIVGQVQTELAQVDLAHEPVSIRVTGCPNGCARPYLGDVGVVGVSKALYHVYVGGDANGTRLNVLYASNVALDNIGASLRPSIQRWKQERRGDERLGDFCHRVNLSAEVPAYV